MPRNILEFREKVFSNRGRMKNVSKANSHLIKIIGTPLEAQAVEHKRIGIARLGEIASTYSTQELHQLTAWLSEHPMALKQEIELFITSLGEET